MPVARCRTAGTRRPRPRRRRPRRGRPSAWRRQARDADASVKYRRVDLCRRSACRSGPWRGSAAARTRPRAPEARPARGRASQTAKVAGRPGSSRPSPVRPAARQPPIVWAAKAADAGIPAVSSCGWTAARTAAQGPSSVTGASEPKASGTPAPARSANRFSCRARSAPSRAAYMPAAPPQSASKHGCMDAARPAAASRPGSRTNSACSMRCPGPIARPSHAPCGVKGIQHLVDRGVADRVEPGLQPRVGATGDVLGDLGGLEPQARRRSPAGRCRAHAARRCASPATRR